MPLPAASTFIEIDQLRSTASAVGGVTKVALAEAPLALSGGIPITSAEIVAGTEDTDSTDEASVGDDTILVEEAVLTVNEVEEVLRGAFAQADQLITDAQEGTIPVGEDLTSDSPRPSQSCVDIQRYPICRGTLVVKVRHEGDNP